MPGQKKLISDLPQALFMGEPAAMKNLILLIQRGRGREEI